MALRLRSLTRLAAPALRQHSRCLAAGATEVIPKRPRIAGGNIPPPPESIDMNLGRTPERTAELERLAEEHNGFLFGELPLKPGESRQWEDWEYSYYPLMTSAVVIYALAWYYRPNKTTQSVARIELERRIAAGEVEEDS